MEEMDYVMHHPDASASPAQQQDQQIQAAFQQAQAVRQAHGHGHGQGQQNTPQHAPQQSQGCPYFRPDHHQNYQHQQQQLSNLPQYPQQQHPQQTHPTLHQQHPHPHQPQHQGTAFLSPSPNRSTHQSHQHSLYYDPVHSAGNTSWNPSTHPAFPWPAQVGLPPHHQIHHYSRSSGSDPYISGLSGVSGPGQSLGAGTGAGAGVGTGGNGGPGPGQAQPQAPGLMHSQVPHQLPHQLPHHDPFTAFFHRQPPNLHRFPGGNSAVQHNHHHNQPTQSNNGNASSGHFNPSTSLNADRGMNPAQSHPSIQSGATRGPSLPALNPQPTPSHLNSTMSSSGESSPDILTNRPPLFGSLDESPRGLNPSNGVGNRNSAPLTGPPQSRPLLFGDLREPSRVEATPTAASEIPDLLPAPPAPPNTERRRNYTVPRPQRLPRQAAQNSDYDSDEDLDQLDGDQALRFIEQFQVGSSNYHRDMGEAQVRAHQILRGQISNKRIASKKALSALQSVDMDSLEESERTCVICYNEFGIPNPEGINEAPLRLPGCKHIFGDHCIKKWFEESDSCPYCRDKVHSEPIFPANTQALRDLYRHTRYTGTRPSSDNRTSPFGETLVRIMAQRDERFDASPPRTWQTGERRSPPSEASESRRRTRARHSSFRASPSTANANATRQGPSHSGVQAPTAPLHQSPARERVNPPNLPPHWYPFSQDPRRSLTPLFATQFAPGGQQRPYSYHPGTMGRPPNMPAFQSAEPFALNPPPPMPMGSGHPAHFMAGFPSLMNSDAANQAYQGQPNGPPGMNPGGEPLPGPSQLDAYSQQLPSSASLPPVVGPPDESGSPYGDMPNIDQNMRFLRADAMSRRIL
ncbi:hypothetical protein B0H66DRAFT_528174 [Apodospora peruviana]|uniref:RING-type domain-containing protein n=1 Tax=Apodospora peruviana TaxID=516989 RepID=A0AAE0ITB1_9PEZI|nr:hypothetical protein B0H66DRAFT_528174 [Apodospora peruviana]